MASGRLHRAARVAGALAGISVVASAAIAGPEVSDPDTVRSSSYIAVRDGTRLAVNIYRPAKDGVARDGRFPIVFAFTPYRARYFDKDGRLVDMIDQPVFGLRDLVHAGYVVATADVRGKGASFGARRGFLDQTEAHDGYDLVQWLAARPWSSGKVGIVGCSYLGGSAMLVAGTLPPALRAVFAGATDIDKYSFVRQGGITAQFNTRPDEPPEVDLASVPVDGDTSGALLKAAVAQHAGNTPMAKLWATMPYRDSVSPLTHNRFWAEVGPYTHLKALRSKQLAWYLWGNWEDEPTEQMILAAGNLDSKLSIGAGSHCVPPTVFSITGEERRFFDHYLKGVNNGIEREPRYAWYHEAPGGTGTMVRSTTLPGVGVARTAFYLSGAPNDAPASVDDGSLATALPAAKRATFKVDYNVGAGEYFAFWPPVLDGKGLTYSSAPLARAASMTGYPVARINAALDRTDANLFVYLEDVAPDGTVHMVSFARLAASHRKLSTAPYARLGLPYHSGLAADVAPMIPGKAADFTMAMSPRAYSFAAGHRLRVTLTGADPRQRNLAQIRQDPPPVFTITQGGAAASRIDIPFNTKPAFR